MERDFLKKYESEICAISDKLIDTKKKWKCSRIKGAWKEIFDEICKLNIDMSLCRKFGYLPVHILSRHLQEEDIYEHLLFIFKVNTSEVLFLLVSTNSQIIDMNKVNKKISKLSGKKELKDFFSEMIQNDMDILSWLTIAEAISKDINVLNIEIQKTYIDDINNLFGIIDKKESMTIFGYFLYIFFYKQFTQSTEYYSMLNIVFNPKNYESNKLMAVLSLLYSMICSKKEFPPENIATINDIETKKKILKKFKHAQKYKCAFNYKKSEEITKRLAEKSKGGIFDGQFIVPKKNERQINKLIVIDYSEPSKRITINNLLDIYSNEVKERHFDNSIIILSKKKIEKNIVLPINFENLNSEKYIDSKKICKTIRKDLLKKLKKFIRKKYKINKSFDEITAIEKKIKKVSNKIYDSAVIGKHLADRYAPIILALYDFFEFLRSKYFITQEDYDKFIKDCDAIYDAEDTSIDIPYNNLNDDPVIIFSKAIYELYENNNELFLNSPNSELFIYDKSKKADKLICFKDIDKSVEFIKSHIDKIHLADSFNTIFVQSESIEYILPKIKDVLIEKGIQFVNQKRKDYKINGKLYFALDVEKLKEFVEQCE